MKVAALQTDIVWEDPRANFARLVPQLASAVEAGARLLVLPETYACGFSMDTERVAEPPDGPSTSFLVDQARRLDAWIGASVPIRDEAGALPFNTFLLAGPAGELHRYRKVHPFTYAMEHEHYAAGRDLVTIDVEGLRVTPFVCYDLRFANEFWARAEATDAYVVVANWPAARRAHWRALLRARAVENQAYVVGVNRVGRGGPEGKLDHAGDSAIVDPWGEVLVEGGPEPTCLVAEVAREVVEDARSRFPVLRDRRRVVS